ncbi:diacylglycerol/lipid kinase family protein [Streptococcus ruminantium]|uniref:diacylglycerol/lipid kinase family protein n=1 Tax=Streptococcus ruminantium TaxID=1917441 RepID=UPI0012DF485F|nr:diacylglycerol kinase family protein [Streptococcus ruminantium]BDD42740.1 diacylglycerol kinase [Streptococcus ruminantium]
MKVLVLYNSKSGSGDKTSLIKTLTTYLAGEGVEEKNICLHEPKSIEEAVALAKQASEERVDLVVTMGGDGTINKIAGGIYEGGGHSVLGILPSGTVNNFAKSLGIPIGEAAIPNLLKGQVKAVKLCQVNQQYAISSLTLGIMADIAAKVTSAQKRKWGPLAYLKDTIRVLFRNRNYYLELRYGQELVRYKTKILLITLTKSIGGITQFDTVSEFDDGLMSVYLFSDVSLWRWLLRLPRIFRGEVAQLQELQHFRTSELSIKQYKRCYRSARTRIDGDKSDYLPVKLTVLPEGIRVMVP